MENVGGTKHWWIQLFRLFGEYSSEWPSNEIEIFPKFEGKTFGERPANKIEVLMLNLREKALVIGL